MKRIIYFFRRLHIHTLRLFLKGKIKLSKGLHIGKRFEIYASKGSQIRIGSSFLCRNDDSLRTDEQGILEIGSDVFLNQNVSITSRKHIFIGDKTMIGPNCVIIDHDHDFRGEDRTKFNSAEIIIGKNVWIGAGCTILKGTVIGDNAVIAAGTIVRGKIPSDTLTYQERTTRTKSIQK